MWTCSYRPWRLSTEQIWERKMFCMHSLRKKEKDMRTNILKFRLTTLHNHLNIHLQNIPHIRRSSNTTSLLKQSPVFSKSMGLPLRTSMVLDSPSNTTSDNRDLDTPSSVDRHTNDDDCLLLRLENRNGIPYVQSTRLRSSLQHAN